MLHVAFDELARSAQQDLFPQPFRGGVSQCQSILQLIAEAKGTAGLVVTAARLNTAGKGLVQQPAIGQQIDGRLRRPYLHFVENTVPVRSHLLQLILQVVLLEVFVQQRFGFFGVLPQPEGEHKAALIAVDQADGRLHRAARIHTGPDFVGQAPQF